MDQTPLSIESTDGPGKGPAEAPSTFSPKIQEALGTRDLSDPENGLHAVNLVIDSIVSSLAEDKEYPAAIIHRTSPICSVADNFDRLLFATDSPSRSSVYTRYINEDLLLRTHTSCMIPELLKTVQRRGIEDVIFLCPGICFRRDVVDRTHCPAPHQMDIWRIKRGEPRLDRESLVKLVTAVVQSVLPGAEMRMNEVQHPYTLNGLEVEVLKGGQWLELLECGEAHPVVLSDAGLDPREYSGLAMGIGLDRVVMLRKGLEDIRLLRSEDPRIAKQMLNLDPYVTVSKYPSIRQDLSIAVDNATTDEDICETIRDVLGNEIDKIEEVELRSETSYEDLPVQARERLGIKPGQKNLLVRIVFRSHERSLTHDEVNRMRDLVYRGLHEGSAGYIR